MAGSIKKFSLCVLALCLFLSQANAGASRGCGKALNSNLKKGATGQSNKINFKTSRGASRNFLLHFPTNYDKNVPHGLIFSFHGRSQTAAQQESLSKLSEPSKNPHMLVVYPNGVDKQWQGDPEAKTDDVGFTMDMINSLQEQYCIDPDKIYATGMSNGGGFSANILACDNTASKRIAAFAGVSGAYYQGSSSANCNADSVPIPCNAGRKNVPVLEFHGKKDDTIAYNGGKRRNRCLPTIPHFMNAWADRNGLGQHHADTNMYNGHVKKMEWGSGNLKGVNTHYAIDNMPHTWPNEKKYYMNATPVIMDFFNKWTLANTPNARVSTAQIQPAASICPTQNGKNHPAGGKNFKIHCSSHTPKVPAYTGATKPGNFKNCIAECARESQCGHAVYYNDKCWKKKGKPLPGGPVRAGANSKVAVKQ